MSETAIGKRYTSKQEQVEAKSFGFLIFLRTAATDQPNQELPGIGSRQPCFSITPLSLPPSSSFFVFRTLGFSGRR